MPRAANEAVVRVERTAPLSRRDKVLLATLWAALWFEKSFRLEENTRAETLDTYGGPRAGFRPDFPLRAERSLATVSAGMSGGVTVAQGPLEAFVMVRIHAGQPVVLRVLMKTIVILALSTLVAWFPGSLAAQSIRPDLNGRVLTESGSPLNGASVFIYTAGPKIGVEIGRASCRERVY